MFRLISTISSHAFPDFQTRESQKESDALIERILLWILYALIVLFLFCQNSWLLVSVEEEFLCFIRGKFISIWIHFENFSKFPTISWYWFSRGQYLVPTKLFLCLKKLFSQSINRLVIDRGIFKSVIKMSCSVRVFQIGKFFACESQVVIWREI